MGSGQVGRKERRGEEVRGPGRGTEEQVGDEGGRRDGGKTERLGVEREVEGIGEKRREEREIVRGGGRGAMKGGGGGASYTHTHTMVTKSFRNLDDCIPFAEHDLQIILGKDGHIESRRKKESRRNEKVEEAAYFTTNRQFNRTWK